MGLKIYLSASKWSTLSHAWDTPKRGEKGERKPVFPSAPRVEHGVLGGPEAQQVPHLVAKLGEVLPQVVEVLHGGLVGALHLLPRGRQVAVHQAAHDLLVVLVALLLEVLPLLRRKVEQMTSVGIKTAPP